MFGLQGRPAFRTVHARMVHLPHVRPGVQTQGSATRTKAFAGIHADNRPRRHRLGHLSVPPRRDEVRNKERKNVPRVGSSDLRESLAFAC